MPLIGLLQRSNASLFERYLSIAGVVDNTTTDNAAAINYAIASATSDGLRKGTFPAMKSRLRVDSTITMDRTLFEINGNGVELNWRFATSGHAFTFTSSGSQLYRRSPGILSNMKILRVDGSDLSMRDDSNTKSMDALYFDSAAEPGPGRGVVQNVVVDGFRYGANFGRNTYLVDLANCWFLRNVSAIVSLNKTAGNFVNQGEGMRVIGGLLWGYRIINIEGVYLHARCSLDYPSAGAPSADAGGKYQYIARVNSGAHLYLDSPHVEFRDTQRSADTAMIYLGADSVYDHRGGPMILSDSAYDGTDTLSNGPDGYHTYANLRAMVEIIGNAQALRIKDQSRLRTSLFKSRSMVWFADAVSVPPNVIDISGSDSPVSSGGVAGKSIAPIIGDQCQLNAALSAVLTSAKRVGLLRDPDFTITAQPYPDAWYIAGAGAGLLAGQTSRYAATNVSVSVSGNTLLLDKAAGAAAALRLYLAVPIERGRIIGIKFRVAKTGGDAGNTITVQLHKAIPIMQDAFYLPKFASTAQVGSTLTAMTFAGSGAEGPVTFDTNSFGATMDDGARTVQNDRGTHMLMYFDLAAVSAETTPFQLQVSRVSVTQG